MDYVKYTSNAEKYSEYRTEYPKEFFNYLYEKIGLSNNSIIADIGSGTGKLSKQLLSKVMLIQDFYIRQIKRRI
jgi:hypothetical protein